MLIQSVSLLGAMLILAAFAGLQLQRCTASSRIYLAANLVGAGALGLVAWLESQWGFLLLEAVWVLVSAWGLLRGEARA